MTVSVEAVRAANTSANPAAEDLTSEALLDRILTSLDQDKAEEIVQ
ncbi:MAG: ribosome silencing factor, partial [Rhodobacteraceae bacterium]|nr:ribosome silencing factor [Paracoccaceae bacterium]